jgi:hypothetical protein
MFGNHVATASFAEPASELHFESTIRLDHVPAAFRAADIESRARTYPFAYAEEEPSDLACFLAPFIRIPRWIVGPPRSSGRTDRPTLTSFSSK